MCVISPRLRPSLVVVGSIGVIASGNATTLRRGGRVMICNLEVIWAAARVGRFVSIHPGQGIGKETAYFVHSFPLLV